MPDSSSVWLSVDRDEALRKNWEMIQTMSRPATMDKTTQENALFKKVQDHMGWDSFKTAKWFYAVNEHLGNLRPVDVIMRGRADKLEKFIDACIAESKP